MQKIYLVRGSYKDAKNFYLSLIGKPENYRMAAMDIESFKVIGNTVLCGGSDIVVYGIFSDAIVMEVSRMAARFTVGHNKRVDVINIGDGEKCDGLDVCEKKQDITERFEYRKPTERGVKQIELIREYCKRLALLIYTEVPESREKEVALEKLEEVSMWANKATVFNVE
jgi:hypothetical protein